MTKPTKWHVRPAKTQISLGIRCPHEESLGTKLPNPEIISVIPGLMELTSMSCSRF